MSNADPGRARPVFQWLAQLFALMGMSVAIGWMVGASRMF